MTPENERIPCEQERELQPCEDTCGEPISTCAMTVYNWVAIQGGARTADEVLAGVRKHGKMLTQNDVRRSLVALTTRQLTVQSGALYDVRDKQRRIVVSRDRMDPAGWRGWRVQKYQPTTSVPMDQALENQ